MWYQVFLQIWIISIISVVLIDGTLTGTTIPDQSGPGSNGNEDVLDILIFQNWGHTIRYNWVSYQDTTFFLQGEREGVLSSAGGPAAHSKSADKKDISVIY